MDLLDTLQRLPAALEGFTVSLLLIGLLALIVGAVCRVAERFGF